MERRLTATELPELAGITHRTLRNIENGAAGSEISTVFAVAALVGVRLFDVDDQTLAMHSTHLAEKLTLLPKSVRHSKQEVDDAF